MAAGSVGGTVIGDLMVRINGSAAGVAAAFAEVGTAATGLQATLAAFGAIGVAATAAITLPILGIGAVALESAVTVQKGYSIIIGQTGLTGEALKKLEGQFDNVFRAVPQSAQDVAKVISTVQIRVGGLGYDVEKTSRTILDMARVTNESSSAMATSLTAMFTQWKLSASEGENAMKLLHQAFQATHVPIAQLAADVNKFGTVWRAAGFDLRETIAIMGMLDEAGLNSTDIVRGMAYSWANLQKASVATKGAMADAYTQISAKAKEMGVDTKNSAQMMGVFFQGVKDGSITSAAAVQIFGSRFGTNIIQAIKEGRIEGDQFLTLLETMPDDIGDVAEAALTLGQRFEILKHNIELAAAPIGFAIMDVIEEFLPIVQAAAKGVEMLAKAFAALPAPIQQGIVLVLLLIASLPPLEWLATKLIGYYVGLGASVTAAMGAITGALTVQTVALTGNMVALSDATLAETMKTAADIAAAGSMDIYTASIAGLSTAYILNATAGEDVTLSNLGQAITTADLVAVTTLSNGVTVANSAIKAAQALATQGATVAEIAEALGVTEATAALILETGATTAATGATIGLETALTPLAAMLLVIAGLLAVIGIALVGFVGGLALAMITSETFRGVVAEVASAFKELWDIAQKAIDAIKAGDWDAAAQVMTKAFESFKEHLMVIDWAEAGKKISEEINKAMRGENQKLNEVWASIKTALIDFFKNTDWTPLGEALGVAFKFAVKIAISALGSLAGIIQAAITGKAPAGEAPKEKAAPMTGEPATVSAQVTSAGGGEEGSLTQAGEEAAAEFSRGFGKGIGDYFSGGEFAGDVGSALAKVDWLDLIVNAVTLKPLAEPIAKAIVGGVGSALGKAFSPESQKGGLLDPNVWNELKNKIGKAWDGIRDGIGKKWDEIKTAAGKKWDEIKTAVGKKWEEIRDSVGKKFDEIKTAIGKKWEEIKKPFEDAAAWFGRLIGEIIHFFVNIGEMITAVFIIIKNAVGKKWDEIRDAIGKKWDEIRDDVGKKWDEIRDAIGKKWDEIRDAVGKKWDEIRDAVGKKWDEIKEAAGKKWDEIKTAVGKKWDEIRDAVGTKFDEVRDAIGKKWDEIKEAAGKKWDEIKTTVGTKAGEAKTAVTKPIDDAKTTLGKIWDDIVAKVKQAFEDIKTFITNFIIPIPQWLHDLNTAFDNLIKKAQEAAGTASQGSAPNAATTSAQTTSAQPPTQARGGTVEAQGGYEILHGPKMVLAGEGGMDEAFIPMPSGRVPVNITMKQSKSEGGPTYNTYVTVDSEGIVRKVFQAIQQLEDYHHLSSGL